MIDKMFLSLQDMQTGSLSVTAYRRRQTCTFVPPALSHLKCRIVPSLAGLRRGSDSRASRQRIVGKWKRAPSSAIEMGMGSTSLASSLLPSFCYACNVSISRTAALRRSCATTGVNDRRQLGIQHASRGSSTRSSCGESVRASSQLEIARKVTTTDRQRCCPTRGGVG